MSRGFWELLLLLFNSAVRPAETGERSCRGDFPDESLAESYLGLGTGPAASRERRGGARDRLSLAGHRRGRTDLPPGDGGSRPDRLSFLHAVRVIRRKLPTYGALPPSGEESIP